MIRWLLRKNCQMLKKGIAIPILFKSAELISCKPGWLCGFLLFLIKPELAFVSDDRMDTVLAEVVIEIARICQEAGDEELYDIILNNLMNYDLNGLWGE